MGPRERAERPRDRLSCHERALRLLSVRPRSRRELETRLLSAGFEEHEVGEVLERLERVGLVDDEMFAAEVVDHAARTGRSGRRAVVSALRAKGVAPDTIARVVEDLGDEPQRALAVAETRVPRLRGLERPVALRRLSEFLMRRGFDPAIARVAATDALGSEIGAEIDPD